jgi:hypothetical protein
MIYEAQIEGARQVEDGCAAQSVAVQFFEAYGVYVGLAGVLLLVTAYAWRRYRVWFWENLFGVAFAHCIFTSLPGVSATIQGFAEIRFDEPH